jgi:hypothetical protein
MSPRKQNCDFIEMHLLLDILYCDAFHHLLGSG